MEISLRCSLGNFHSSDCGLYNRYPQERVVKLNSCQKDIKPHLRALKLSVGGECGSLNPNIPTLTDIETEADLLCRRVGVFTTNLSLTVCPLHRYQLVVDFRQAKTCTHPQHSGKGKTFRGFSSFHSQRMLEEYGVLLPVGNGICYQCHSKLPKLTISNEEDVTQELSVPEIEEDHNQIYNFHQNGIDKDAQVICFTSLISVYNTCVYRHGDSGI